MSKEQGKGRRRRSDLLSRSFFAFMKAKLGDFLFVLPAAIFIAAFLIAPLVESLYLSFFANGKFVGFRNYISILTDKTIVNIKAVLKGPPPWGALVHTVIWVIVLVISTVVLGLGLALLLRDVKGANIIKSIIFLGMVIPMVVGGILVRFMFSQSAGFISNFFGLLGVKSLHVTWTAHPETALASLILVSVWLWTGYGLLVYSAGLTTIPKQVLEAAEIDGADGFKKLRYIILPLLRPVTRIVVAMTMLWGLRLFDVVYAATLGGPGKASTVLSLEVYFLAFRAFDYGRASALATVLMLLTIIPLLFILKNIQKEF